MIFALTLMLGAACYVLGRIHGHRQGVRESASMVRSFTDHLWEQ